jgi:hypothetical protein
VDVKDRKIIQLYLCEHNSEYQRKRLKFFTDLFPKPSIKSQELDIGLHKRQKGTKAVAGTLKKKHSF